MFIRKKNNQDIIYINANSRGAETNFSLAFYHVFKCGYTLDRPIIILCIGTDRVTGDSLGPMIGYKLSQYSLFKEIKIYGTLEYPVHAMNLSDTVEDIYRTYNDPFIIAIDASLGRFDSIGYLTIGTGSITPGLGVNKTLPSVGDMFITGIVNLNLGGDTPSIQNTRLGLVMKMADVAFSGIIAGLRRIEISA